MKNFNYLAFVIYQRQALVLIIGFIILDIYDDSMYEL